MSLELVSASGGQVVEPSAVDRHPDHIAPGPYDILDGWWVRRRMGPRRPFGLCPAGPRGRRSGHQALAFEPRPRAWLQGGAPAAPYRATSRSLILSLSWGF